MARSITMAPFRTMRTRCKCGRDLPVTGVRFTLWAITLESQCEPCRTVHAREYSLTSVGNFAAKEDTVEDALDRAFGGEK